MYLYTLQESRTGVRAALSRLPSVNLVYVAEIIPPADYGAAAFEFKELHDGEGEGDGVGWEAGRDYYYIYINRSYKKTFHEDFEF